MIEEQIANWNVDDLKVQPASESWNRMSEIGIHWN